MFRMKRFKCSGVTLTRTLRRTVVHDFVNSSQERVISRVYFPSHQTAEDVMSQQEALCP